MGNGESELDGRIGARVKGLRAASGLSMEGLAGRSGVSKSMISLIERGETSATAVVLEKLAAGLGVGLPKLFEEEEVPSSPLARKAEQTCWRDPGTGYVRRHVSPPGVSQPMTVAEVELPAGARVEFENARRDAVVHQQVWVLEGTIEVTFGEETHRLGDSDCLAMRLEGPTVYHNPTKRPARYAVIVASEPERRGR